jgi:type IV secretory pathway TraG/TraD family ATPase VirD4
LERAGEADIAASLRGRQQGAPETREGIYETARTAAQCLRDRTITTWLTPEQEVPELRASSFVTSTDTLYLMSKDGAGAAAPLVAALVDAVMRAGVVEAERQGGRLDPPGVVVIDEAANVCRIADLPDLYSHLGSRGIVPLTILQSYKQGQRVWGEIGMATLWGAATVKIIGAGMDDANLAEDISRLIGDVDVDVHSSSTASGSRTRSVSVRQQRMLSAAQVRALPKGQAILLVTGVKAAMIALMPWYGGERRKAIAESSQLAETALTERARRRAGGEAA